MGRFFYTFHFIIANILISESTEVVIQEGSTYSYLYSGNINIRCDTFVWIRADKEIQLCSISSNNIYYICSPRPFARKVEANINVTNNVVKTNLTIINVHGNSSDSDEGVWSLHCAAPIEITITTFEIKLCDKQQSLQCTHMFQENSLKVTCNSQGIYPQALVYTQTNTSGNISTCQNVLDSTNFYYNSACTIKFPTASLSLGKLDINMTVYPNLTSLISDTNFGDSRLLTINLETPHISLTDCPEKVVIEDVPFSCTCERSDVSDVLTNTSWLINGTEYSSSSNSISVLNNIASRYNTNYTCIAVNVLGWKSIPLIYIPSVVSQSSKNSNSITGEIVGGCVGAFVAIVLTIIIILLIRRKQCFKCKEKEQKNIELSSHSTNNGIKKANTRVEKKNKILKSKKDDTDVAEKLDSIINVLRSLETRQKILEQKLNSPSERSENTGDVVSEAQYDILRQPVDNIEYVGKNDYHLLSLTWGLIWKIYSGSPYGI